MRRNHRIFSYRGEISDEPACPGEAGGGKRLSVQRTIAQVVWGIPSARGIREIKGFAPIEVQIGLATHADGPIVIAIPKTAPIKGGERSPVHRDAGYWRQHAQAVQITSKAVP